MQLPVDLRPARSANRLLPVLLPCAVRVRALGESAYALQEAGVVANKELHFLRTTMKPVTSARTSRAAGQTESPQTTRRAPCSSILGHEKQKRDRYLAGQAV